MERKAIEAKNALNFIIRSFPEDDLQHKESRDAFVIAVEHLTKLVDYLAKEEHEGLEKAKLPGEECPCTTCKAERFIEVLTNLDRDQLLEIIASESGIHLNSTERCKLAPITEEKEAVNEIIVTPSQ
jgi:hypothetical protein